MNTEDWKEDPRLARLDPEKLKYITSLAERISSLPKDQLLPALLSLQMDAAKNGIRFTDEETDLLVSVISSQMPPAERKKLDTLKLLAKKLAARSS